VVGFEPEQNNKSETLVKPFFTVGGKKFSSEYFTATSISKIWKCEFQKFSIFSFIKQIFQHFSFTTSNFRNFSFEPCKDIGIHNLLSKKSQLSKKSTLLFTAVHFPAKISEIYKIIS
jgi:hypothetical protein